MPISRSACRRTALVVVAVLAMSGCVAWPVDGPGRAGPAARALPTEVPAVERAGPVEPADDARQRGSAQRPRTADGTETLAEFQEDIAGAERIARDYWRRQLAERGSAFSPIRRVLGYEAEGELSCGDQPLGLRNAAYCGAGDFIAYDVNWAYEAFRQIGDAFIFYLVGHEYAHGIQARLRVRSNFTIQHELQADCMAGAYIGDSTRSGALRIKPGDLEEFRTGLLAVGDDPGQPWFADNAHGTAQQRSAAFRNGYERSLAACGLD